MYQREIESNAEAKRKHDDNLKENAAKRLRDNQEYNRRNKYNVKKDK